MSSSEDDNDEEEEEEEEPELEPPLYSAVCRGDIRHVIRLIGLGADVNARHGPDQDSAIRAAAARGNSEMMTLLLDNEADPDMSTTHGTSPIHMCALKGYIDQALILIRAAANVSVKTHAGFSPLDYAVRSPTNSLLMIRMLVQNGAFIDDWHPTTGQTSLSHAVQNTRHRRPAVSREAIATLIELGADVNATDFLGMTPLYITAMEKNRDLLMFLIEKGTEFSIRTPHNLSQLYKVIDLMGVLQRNLAFASGRHRVGSKMHPISLDMVNMITSRYTLPQTETDRMVFTIALVALNWIE
jgi:ankyrin repeat protein